VEPGHDRQGGAHGVELGRFEESVAFHLRLAQAASFRAFKRQTGLHKLRPGWYAVLSLIADNPGVTPVALSRASGRDKSTITPVVRDLLREGLIFREAIPTDRRSFGLRLAPAGEPVLAHLAACAAEHDAAIERIVGARKRELVDQLREIVAGLD